MECDATRMACMNCGESMPHATRYCGHCGQDHRYPRLRLRDIASDALSEFISFDRPWIKTLRAVFPECGTLARNYVEGRRADRVNPLRFLLLTLGLLFLVTGAVNAYMRLPDGPHSQWLPVALFIFTLPMAYLLRFFCASRQDDIAEIIVLVCYALSAAALGWILVLLLMLSRYWNFFIVTTSFYALLLVPAYWTASLKRFFHCAGWRALVAAYVVGFLGLAGFSGLMQLITDIGGK
jgi:hypothetical protein